jgi:signal recognition particle receptor subunit beta
MSDIIEAKILFTGPVGAGNTTAIKALSDFEPITTDVVASDETSLVKETTTVGMDYGEVQIDEHLVLRLYGTPGQRRFAHMWSLLAEGALGFIILVDNSRRLPLSDLSIYLDSFKTYIAKTAAVIAITRSDLAPQPDMEAYYTFLRDRGEMYPVMTADVRRKEDVLMLVDTLLTCLELKDA